MAHLYVGTSRSRDESAPLTSWISAIPALLAISSSIARRAASPRWISSRLRSSSLRKASVRSRPRIAIEAATTSVRANAPTQARPHSETPDQRRFSAAQREFRGPPPPLPCRIDAATCGGLASGATRNGQRIAVSAVRTCHPALDHRIDSRTATLFPVFPGVFVDDPPVQRVGTALPSAR